MFWKAGLLMFSCLIPALAALLQLHRIAFQEAVSRDVLSAVTFSRDDVKAGEL